MCQGLGDLRQAMTSYSVGFDSEVVSVHDARGVVAHAVAIESAAATLKALAAARMAGAGGDPKRRGARSAAHDLAASTGIILGAARDVLDAGKALGSQGAVSDAARRGELSAARVGLITEGTAADPSTEVRLIELAAGGSIAELRAEVGRIKAKAKPDPEAARKDIHAGEAFGPGPTPRACGT